MDIELGEFDTGQYSGCEFTHCEGDGVLKIHIEEVGTIEIKFNKVRHFQYTALPNCSTDMIEAYFKVADLGTTKELKSFLANDNSSSKVYDQLKHYRIFLDETGCYDIYSEQAKKA